MSDNQNIDTTTNINETDTNKTSTDHSDDYEKICYVCRRPESKAGEMITMPGGMNFCHECMQKAFDSISKSGMDFSKLQNMPFMNMNLNDFAGMQVPNTEIPEKNKIKKKSKAKDTEKFLTMKDVPAPHQIKAQLDAYVIGQERAKRAVSVAVYNHYKRVILRQQDELRANENTEEKAENAAAQGMQMQGGEPEIEKSNILMLGPTGSGKTYLVKTLAKLLDVPLAIADATALTEAGYIGDDIESVVSKLLAAAGNDVEKAEQGIIFIDEIDKIAKKKNTMSRDVSGESVQQGMLKLLEGSDVEVPVGATSKNAMVPLTTVNTRNILFICGGAFDGLEKIIERRLDQKSIGFGANVQGKKDKDISKILHEVQPHDLLKFGIIPELVGRLPVIAPLNALQREDLVRILQEPKNALVKQYKKLLEYDDVDLEFTEDALNAIADKAIERNIGARGLRAVMEGLLTKVMYEIPSDETVVKAVVTKECVEGTAEPELTHDPNKINYSVKLNPGRSESRSESGTPKSAS